MLTFEHARKIAGAYAEQRFAGPGTFHVAEYGRSDGAFALVLTGAREWLEGRDPAFLVPDDEVLIVNLATGDLTPTDYLHARELIASMDPIGPWPDDE